MRIPPSFYYTVGRFLLFIAIEAICIVMASNNGIVQQYKVMGAVREVQALFWNIESSIESYSRLKTINEVLTAQNVYLMEKNTQLQNALDAIGKNNTADTLHTEADSSFTYNWAKVIKNSTNTTHNYIIINKGSNHGITEDMGVITPNGVVGIVRAVGPNHSYVLSFLNPKQQISAKLAGNAAFGPLSWDGNDIEYATLSEIPQHIAVTPGDTVYTSGYSLFFPPNIPIGVAESSRIVNGMHKSIRVRLLQDFRLLDHVITVKNNHINEIEDLLKNPVE